MTPFVARSTVPSASSTPAARPFSTRMRTTSEFSRIAPPFSPIRRAKASRMFCAPPVMMGAPAVSSENAMTSTISPE